MKQTLKWPAYVTVLGVLCLVVTPVAADEQSTLEIVRYSIDNLVLFISAVLVLFMQAGFASLEAGMSPANNTVNVLFKNFADMCIGVLSFYLIGYSIMYGPDVSGLGILGWNGFGVSSTIDPAKVGPGVLHPQVDWLFQVAFAATAATKKNSLCLFRLSREESEVIAMTAMGLSKDIRTTFVCSYGQAMQQAAFKSMTRWHGSASWIYGATTNETLLFTLETFSCVL